MVKLRVNINGDTTDDESSYPKRMAFYLLLMSHSLLIPLQKL
jgi:hypothetical protein